MNPIFMKRAMELASQGIGRVNPNPLVGAVIVKDGKIIGEGYHACFGEAHAEVNAFLNATEDVSGADMYVTLEPCAHYGKTPPCALKIVEKKISNVYIGTLDPNPKVNHQGVDILRNAGIHVSYGILEDEVKSQNEVFLRSMIKKKPFVAMKYAMTLDGKLATEAYDSKWITNEKSRAFVHELRHQYMAIMVGANTVVKDNPLLTARRKEPSRNPIRIIIDPQLVTPMDSQVVITAKETKTMIITQKHHGMKRLEPYLEMGVEIIEKKADPEIDLSELMTDLFERGIDGILIEGGSYMHASALKYHIVDKVYAFIAPKIVGGSQAIFPVGGKGFQAMKDAYQLTDITYQTFDQDLLIQGYLTYEKKDKTL